MDAEKQSKPAPAPPEINDPRLIRNASDFAGVFSSPSGRELEVVAEGSALSIVADGKKIPLESQGGDAFLADDYSWLGIPV
jgi:hypothetical protein